MKPSRRRPIPHGYSMIEAVLAGALLAIGIGAAAIMAGSLVQQEEVSAEARIMLNYQEQAARLFHLGLDPSTATNLLPITVVTNNQPPTNTIALGFVTESGPVGTLGTMENATVTLIYPSRIQQGGNYAHTTNRVFLVRPSIR